jgi:succinate dehydrogenase / fumarate reductase flavoprotein subunit
VIGPSDLVKVRTDVLVVGAGLAGLAAAVRLRELDAKADVRLVSKVHPVRSHSGAAQGGINAAMRTDDRWEDHKYDTIKGSAYLADQDAVRVLCSEAPEAIRRLDRYGSLFTRNPDGSIAQRAFGGQRTNRTCFVADKTGHVLLHTLYEQAVRRGIPLHYDCFVLAFLRGRGKIAGALAYDLQAGKFILFECKAMVVATGGAGRVVGQSSNALINTGDGAAMALAIGLPLLDMEFLQIHPTGILNGILVTEGARGEGGHLVNKDGERFMARYAPKFMELGPRDLVARSIQREINEGRAFAHGGVHLDLTHLGREKILSALGQIREIAIFFAGVDPIEAPIPVRPTAHYTMGGIDVDVDCRTALPGFFSAGESSCVSVHGANRLGGNSLMETVVFGVRAGQSVGRYLSGEDFTPVDDAELGAVLGRLNDLLATKDGELPGAIRGDMERTMIANFGIFRSLAPMRAAVPIVDDLRTRYRKVWLRHKGAVYNQDLVHAWQLGNMLDLCRVIALGASHRLESRGAHHLEEYPKLDNENFLTHTVVRRREDGSLELGYKPVTIEDVEPASEIQY